MAAKTINGLHGRVIPCRAAIELDWVADVSSLGSLLDRLAARMSLTMYRVLVHYTYA